MIKLHPETAQEIADLICRIDVAEIMRSCANNKNDLKARFYWMADGYKAVIKLTEEYGIPHNTYKTAVDAMKDDSFANATLANLPDETIGV